MLLSRLPCIVLPSIMYLLILYFPPPPPLRALGRGAAPKDNRTERKKKKELAIDAGERGPELELPTPTQ